METIDVKANRAECMNGVNSYINKIAPQLIAELSKGFKLTVDNRLFKKDKERIQAIIDSIPHFRAYLDMGAGYSIHLKVDDNYKVKAYPEGGYCVNYYDNYVYLWDIQNNKAYEPGTRDMVTKEQLVKGERELQELRDSKNEIESKISKLNLLLGR